MAHCLRTPKVKGDEIVLHPCGKHLVPKERHNIWSEYLFSFWGDGTYCVVLVRKFLAQRIFWPRDIMPVASLVPVALARAQN